MEIKANLETIQKILDSDDAATNRQATVEAATTLERQVRAHWQAEILGMRVGCEGWGVRGQGWLPYAVVMGILTTTWTAATGEDFQLLQSMNNLSKEEYAKMNVVAQRLLQQVSSMVAQCTFVSPSLELPHFFFRSCLPALSRATGRDRRACLLLGASHGGTRRVHQNAGWVFEDTDDTDDGNYDAADDDDDDDDRCSW